MSGLLSRPECHVFPISSMPDILRHWRNPIKFPLNTGKTVIFFEEFSPFFLNRPLAIKDWNSG
jgi:hypothetical protein